jgi:hypothetical protein
VTYETIPAQPVAPPPPPPPPLPPAPKPAWYRRKLTWVLAGVVVLFVIAAAVGASGDDTKGSFTADDASADTTEPADDEVTETTEAPTTTTTEAPAPASPTTGAMGATFNFEQTGYDGRTVVDATVANPRFENIEYSGPALIVDATFAVTAESEGSYTAGPYNFKLVLADGTVMDTGCCLPDTNTELPTIEVAAGQRATGAVMFQIDQARAAGAKIQLDDIGMDYGKPLAYWQL